MKSNHVGQRVFGIITLIFSILTMPITAITVFFYLYPDMLPAIQNWLLEFVQTYAPDTEVDPSMMTLTIDLATMISTAAITLVTFIIAITLLGFASPRGRAKMNDVFGLQRQGYYRYKGAPIFIILGAVVLIGVQFVRQSYSQIEPYFNIIMFSSLGVLLFGLLLLIPVPANWAVKRRYHGNKVTITIPRNRLIKGSNPNQIINELSAHEMMGYEDLDDFKDMSNMVNKNSMVKFTLSSPSYDRSELRANRRQFIKEATKSARHNEYLYPNYDFEIEELEGRTYSTSRDLKTRVSYDTVTTWSDGSKTYGTSYKDVKTGEEITFKKSVYYQFTFFYVSPDDGKKYYLYDDKDNIFEFTVYGRTLTLGKMTKGYGD